MESSPAGGYTRAKDGRQAVGDWSVARFGGSTLTQENGGFFFRAVSSYKASTGVGDDGFHPRLPSDRERPGKLWCSWQT